MRMWEIREGDYNRGESKRDYFNHHGESKDRELKEAYECGFEDGYEEAMKEIEGHNAYRSYSSYNRMRKR